MPSPQLSSSSAVPGPVTSRRAELLRSLADQEQLLLAVASGLPRDSDRDREFWMRARTIQHGLAEVGLRYPLPYRDLAAWVAECHLRLRDPEAQRNMIRTLLQPVRAALSAAPAPDTA